MKRFIKNLVVSFRFWNAKRKANNAHNITGKRYYVIHDNMGHFIIVNNSYIKAYNKKANHPSQRINFTDLINMSDYMTKQRGRAR